MNLNLNLSQKRNLRSSSQIDAHTPASRSSTSANISKLFPHQAAKTPPPLSDNPPDTLSSHQFSPPTTFSNDSNYSTKSPTPTETRYHFGFQPIQNENQIFKLSQKQPQKTRKLKTLSRSAKYLLFSLLKKQSLSPPKHEINYYHLIPCNLHPTEITMSFRPSDYPDIDAPFLRTPARKPVSAMFAPPIPIPQLQRVEAELFVRSLYAPEIPGYMASNLPKDPATIARTFEHFSDLGLPTQDLPFTATDTLDDDVFQWAHASSSKNRPAMVSTTATLIRFTASQTSASGKALVCLKGAQAFPLYSEHRVPMLGLTKPHGSAKSARPVRQTRLVHHQAYKIPHTEELMWEPLLYIAGLGPMFSSSKADITEAVQQYIRMQLVHRGRPEIATLYEESSQLTWHYVQFDYQGKPQTVPVAELRLRKSTLQPEADFHAILEFAAAAPPLILSILFGTTPADDVQVNFLGIPLRVIRSTVGSILGAKSKDLISALVKAPPSKDLYSVTLRGLVPHPSLLMIHQILSNLGLSSLRTIVYAHEELSRDYRPNRQDWPASTFVRLILSSPSEAYMLQTSDHAQRLLSRALQYFLQHADTSVTLRVHPPVDIADAIVPGRPAPQLTPTIADVSPDQFHSRWSAYEAVAVEAHLQSLLTPAPPAPDRSTLLEPGLTTPPTPSTSSSSQSETRPNRRRLDSETDTRPTAIHPPGFSPLPTPPSFDQLRRLIYENYTQLYSLDPPEAHMYLVSLCERSAENAARDGYLTSQDDPDEEAF